MFGVPSADQLVDDTSEAAGDAVIGLANTVYPNVGSTGTESDDTSTSSSDSTSGSSGDGDTYGWERQGGAPNHLPDATEDTVDDGYTADDTISDDAADYDRVLNDIQGGGSDAVYTGDMSNDDSAPSNANGSTPNSSNSDVSIPALGVAGASTSTMLVAAFVLVGVLVVAAGALGGDGGGSPGGSAA